MPDILQIALERGGVAPDAAVFVGDTVWDVEACRKAGLACIAFRTGGISSEELRDAGAVEIYDGPAELLEIPTGQPHRPVICFRSVARNHRGVHLRPHDHFV